MLVDQDEISLGEKFTTQTIPRLGSFIDWVFQSSDLTVERRAEVEKSKQVRSFFDLIEMDDAALRNFGIRSELVRSKLLNAARNWRDKYRFPAFRFELIGKGFVAPRAD